jgi:hypothetical protein
LVKGSSRESSSDNQKLIMQEDIEEILDSQLHYFNGAHYASTSDYGFSPNELHFGYNLPNNSAQKRSKKTVEKIFTEDNFTEDNFTEDKFRL